MYIDDNIDKVLSESLSPSEFKELVAEGAFDSIKQSILTSLFSRLVYSINRCASDTVTKSDVFKAIQSTKGDIEAYQLYGPNQKITDICSALASSDSTKQYSEDIKVIYDFLVRRKRDFMHGYKNDNSFVKTIYVSLVSSLTVLGSISICILTNAGKLKQTGLDTTIKSIVNAINNHSLDKVLDSQDKLITKESAFTDTATKALGALGLGAITSVITGVGSSALAMGAAIISAIIVFLLSAKLIVFYIYESRIKLSDFLYQNALLLELHRDEVANNDKYDQAKKEAIIKRQKKLASLLLKISEKIAVDSITSKRRADDANKRDTDGIVKDTKDSSTSGSGDDIVI